MAERYANCTVSYEMHSDRRFDLLAQLAGWTRPEACWRMVELWARCTALQTDRPPADEIRIHLGLRGEQLLVDATLAERQPDGSIRVLGGGLSGGDTDRFGWFAPVARRGAAGGLARKTRAVRDQTGKFVPATANAARSSERPSDSQQATSEASSEASKPPASYPQAPASGFRIPDQRSEALSAHAIPPYPVPSTNGNSFDAEATRHRANGHLAESIWQAMGVLRTKHAVKLRLDGVIPFDPITPGNEPRGFRELRVRIREAGDNARAVCAHVLEVHDKQATDTKSIEWLAEKAFLAGPWEKARNTVLAKRKPPVAAQPSAPLPVSTLTPEERIALAVESRAALYGSKEPA